jgi:hypothetical protein
LKKTCRAQQKISGIREIRGLLKIIVVYKEVEAYEEQGVLEDIDTNHRDSADSTGNHAGSDQLYVKEMRVGQKFDLPSFLLLANNHLDEATARDDETLGLFICNY